MVFYICPRCGYTTNRKSNIKNHINRKILCEENVCDIVPKNFEKQILYGDQSYIINKLCDERKILKDKLKIYNDKINKQNEEISYLKTQQSKRSGYIYVLHNPDFYSWGISVYKIGCSNNPERRLKDLSTSYQSESKIVYKSKLFQDKLKAEKRLFKLIEKYRTSKREFFDISKEVLVQHIDSL